MFEQLLKLMKSLGTPLAMVKGPNAGKGFFITNVRFNDDRYSALCEFVSDKCSNLTVSHKAETFKDTITTNSDGVPMVKQIVDTPEVIFVTPPQDNEYNDLESVDISFNS